MNRGRQRDKKKKKKRKWERAGMKDDEGKK